jgi:hypothetical protein
MSSVEGFERFWEDGRSLSGIQRKTAHDARMTPRIVRSRSPTSRVCDRYATASAALDLGVLCGSMGQGCGQDGGLPQWRAAAAHQSVCCFSSHFRTSLLL